MPLPRRFLCRKRDPPTIRQENHLEQIKLARSKASNLLVPDDYDGSTYHAKLSRELAAVSLSTVSLTLHLLGALRAESIKTAYRCFRMHARFSYERDKARRSTILFPTLTTPTMRRFDVNETKPIANTILSPTVATPTMRRFWHRSDN